MINEQFSSFQELGLEWFKLLTNVTLRGSERVLDAQLEGCQNFYGEWVKASKLPWMPMPEQDPLGEQLELGLHFSRNVYLAQLGAQTDLMQLSERVLLSGQREFLKQLEHIPGTSKMQSAVEVGVCALDSLSKATRQVTSFAGNNLSAAGVRAVQVARDKLQQPPAHRGQKNK